jgi:hypothetical protein
MNNTEPWQDLSRFLFPHPVDPPGEDAAAERWPIGLPFVNS